MLPEIVLTFHCLNKLFLWSQIFWKFSAFSLEFQKIFSIARTIKRIYLRPRCLNKSGYYIVLSPSTTIMSLLIKFYNFSVWSGSSEAHNFKPWNKSRRKWPSLSDFFIRWKSLVMWLWVCQRNSRIFVSSHSFFKRRWITLLWWRTGKYKIGTNP